ncbi:MAG TPA: nucleotidyltransferase domain-containing protein [Micromonosporaceae bacterium]|nr:nucleotidyltransferase domain-containing protein [Micromonosporaceae bacterium]
MSTPARECSRRAADWAANHALVAAAVVFGSVASGLDDEYSDLDLILVGVDGAGEDLWQRRREIARSVLGDDVVTTQQPAWQGARRFQAWTSSGLQLDLTIVEGVPAVFGGLAKGFVAIYDRDNIDEQLTRACASWTAPPHDAAMLDVGTWAWLRYLHGRLRRGEFFAVRAGVHDTLMYRVVPMLGSQWHSAHAELSDTDMQRIHAAAPTSAEPAELARSLHATATAYDWALDRWSARTGRDRPRDPLAALTLARLRPPEAEQLDDVDIDSG